jgi:hypothetical protein
MVYVWQTPYKGAQKLMLLAIADRCDDEGVCFPGVGTLAKKCCVEDRNVQKMIVQLEALGELAVVFNKGYETTHGSTNLYYMKRYRDTLGMTTPASSKRKKRYGVSSATSQEVSRTTSHGVSSATPNTSVDSSEETKESVASYDARTATASQSDSVSIEGIENTSQTDFQTDESLQKKESTAEGRPRAAKVRSPKQEANDAANAMLIQGLGEAWGVMAVPSDEKDYLIVARKLVAGTVPLAEFKWYAQYQIREAKAKNYTFDTVWGLIAKGRISKYVQARNDYRAQQEAGTVKGAWTGGEAKGGAYYHKAAPLQTDSVPTVDVMALFAEEGQS